VFLAFQAFDFFRRVAPDNFGVSRLRLKARFAENEFWHVRDRLGESGLRLLSVFGDLLPVLTKAFLRHFPT
jgi:hypothetical protein